MTNLPIQMSNDIATFINNSSMHELKQTTEGVEVLVWDGNDDEPTHKIIYYFEDYRLTDEV
jgi:hypothetical protein